MTGTQWLFLLSKCAGVFPLCSRTAHCNSSNCRRVLWQGWVLRKIVSKMIPAVRVCILSAILFLTVVTLCDYTEGTPLNATDSFTPPCGTISPPSAANGTRGQNIAWSSFGLRMTSSPELCEEPKERAWTAGVLPPCDGYSVFSRQY